MTLTCRQGYFKTTVFVDEYDNKTEEDTLKMYLQKKILLWV
jgi:hypothetical protein